MSATSDAVVVPQSTIEAPNSVKELKLNRPITIGAKTGKELISEMEKSEMFTTVVFCTDKGVVLASNVDDTANLKIESTQYATIFGDREEAMEFGVFVNEGHFDVHRHYEDLIYGRRQLDEMLEGEGFVVCKHPSNSHEFVFGVATFRFPVLTANAVPILVEYTKHAATKVFIDKTDATKSSKKKNGKKSSSKSGTSSKKST